LPEASLNIWDTSGYELDLHILPKPVYTNTSAYLVVLSYDNKDSLHCINNYIDYIIALDKMAANGGSILRQFNIYIVINKADLNLNERSFSTVDIYSKLKEYNGINITIQEVSAKNGYNIAYLFESLQCRLSGKSDNGKGGSPLSVSRRQSFRLAEESMKKKKRCC
jgi:hypothetical protein